MEEAQLQIKTTRIETLKSHERLAAVARCAKARSESAHKLPQKQLRSARRRQHRVLQAELRAKQEQQQIADIRQTQQLEEQTKSMHYQTRKQQLVEQDLLTHLETDKRHHNI